MTPHRITSAVIALPDLHLAFPSGQAHGTRLVLTQSTYQLQRWLDWLEAHPDVIVVADADRTALSRCSPETFAGRGPWSRIEIVDVGEGTAPHKGAPYEGNAFDDADVGPAFTARQSDDADVGRAFMARQSDGTDVGRAFMARQDLHDAFVQPDAALRLDVCRQAIEAEPDSPALLLAFASTCMELQLFDDAKAGLQRTLTLAPDWEAVHFELGKLLLRLEETEGAAAAFAEAGRLMPTFAAAHSNLGAALGELERPGDALQALTRALELDPRGYPILNNIGAVHRDEGRLDDAERAFRQVIAIAPDFVFGRYNLAHTLFLKGNFAAARQAYEDAFDRDPQRNPRQACRLAVARAAAGDPDGAIALLVSVCEELPREMLGGMLGEVESTLAALSHFPGCDADEMNRVLAALRPYSS